MPRFDSQRAANHYVNDALRYALYCNAARPCAFFDFAYVDKRPWYRRWWAILVYRVDPWIPRLHLGPCDHEDCDV